MRDADRRPEDDRGSIQGRRGSRRTVQVEVLRMWMRVVLPRRVRSRSLPGVLHRAWVAGFSARVLPAPAGPGNPGWAEVEFLLDIETATIEGAGVFEIEFISALPPRCRLAVEGEGCRLDPISRPLP
ncbi:MULTISPECIES: hypothetical protein [unclassified Curtobacterium]|uniref:hypothetical protein n=1 Tax=unclassified Curtobacterium TaxID=257496 RepID=UPI000D8D4233|nr:MULTISPECIES: hypothetical protein [unclassified Curtobacterium]PYY36379.1 hypothetical protein DEI89_04200 [Curtobacterium sp. MCBD17_030]PZE37188.1 hypothetical protein DEJ31_08730 [Curtobacterium sp. MCPF17_031]PZF15477.1 hypothetical protein DEJ25_01750 [Curtobacterium sp. MCPF17_011]